MSPQILVYSQDAGDAESVRGVLHADFPRLLCTTEPAEAADLLTRHAPPVVALSFPAVAAAETAYLGLFRHAHDFALPPHATLALCRLQDAPSFYRLCRDGIFDHYLVDKPLYDPHGIRLAVLQLLGRAQERQAVRCRAHTIGSELQDAGLQIRESVRKARDLGAHLPVPEGRFALSHGTSPQTLPVDPGQAAQGDEVASRATPERVRLEEMPTGLQQLGSTLRLRIDEICESMDGPLDRVSEIGSALADAGAGRTRAILVVDDMESFRAMVRDILNDMGLRTTEAGSGPAALAVMHRDPPQLVLLDFDMPGMNGLQVVDEMHRTPRLCDTPIIMLTGLGTRDVVMHAREHGVVDFLVKPVRRDVLREKVMRHLSAAAGTRA